MKALKNSRSPCGDKQLGVSLVELMVAMVIALTLSLAIFSVLGSFEGRKRTTTSINDINQTGNYALYAIDKWVRSAGSGFSQSDGTLFGCTLTAAKNGTQILPRSAALPAPFASVNPGTANTFRLVPILIGPGQTAPAVSVAGTSTATSDVLVIMAGASGNGEVATNFGATPTATQLNLNSSVGFSANDLLLITDLSSGSTGTPCMLQPVSASFSNGLTFTNGAISATPTNPVTALTLNTGTTAPYYYKATINSKALTSYNDMLYGTVINLGNIANWSTTAPPSNPPIFLVLGVGDNNTLFGYDLLENQNPVVSNAQAAFPVADGVFEMHALYGVDTDNNGTLDSWTGATGNFTPANLTAGTAASLARLKSIKAIRIGLIMRTSTLEKNAVAPASLTLFSDLDSSVQFTRTFNSSNDEMKYRYRAVEATIPLRNQIMLSN